MTDKIVVLTTCGSAVEAETLARRVIGAGMAACVNVIPQIRSFYKWKGVVENAEEWQLEIKTSREKFHELRLLLETAHSYELPEVLALPVVDGSPNYLAWMDGELHPPEAA